MGRASRPATQSRSSCRIELIRIAVNARTPAGSIQSGRVRLPGLLLLGLLLTGCAATIVPEHTASLPDPAKPPAATATAELTPAAQREHQRILAAYNGVYDDPRLEALVNQTVEKLVAASERPDQRYRITILNSPAINAFALPSGQLYVTRGLIALANDSSELASVLSHEMAHVIAQPRRHPRGPSTPGRAGHARGQRPARRFRAGTRSRSPNRRSRLPASRAPRNSKPTASASASPRAPATILTARCVFSVQWDATPILKRHQARIDPRAPDFLSSHPATPERVKNAQNNARQFGAPGVGGERDRAAYLAAVDGMVYGDDPSEGLVKRPPLPASQARLYLRRARRFCARQYRAGRPRRQGGRRPGLAPGCRARAVRADAPRLSQFWLDREYRRQERRGHHHQWFSRPRPRRPRATSGRSGCSRCASAAMSIASSSPPRG